MAGGVLSNILDAQMGQMPQRAPMFNPGTGGFTPQQAPQQKAKQAGASGMGFDEFMRKILAGREAGAAPEAAMPAVAGPGLGGAGASDLAMMAPIA